MFENWLAKQLEKAIRESPYMKGIAIEDEAAFKAGILQIAQGVIKTATATDVDVLSLVGGLSK